MDYSYASGYLRLYLHLVRLNAKLFAYGKERFLDKSNKRGVEETFHRLALRRTAGGKNLPLQKLSRRGLFRLRIAQGEAANGRC